MVGKISTGEQGGRQQKHEKYRGDLPEHPMRYSGVLECV